MRITNDEYSPIELLCELKGRAGITEEDTKKFFAGERGKHDWLVSNWSEKLDEILRIYKRYGTLVAETQSVRDQGIDVYWRFNSAGVERTIGFQIKSNSEAEADSKKKIGQESMIATLKRQAFEAAASHKVDEWWIVACFDYSKYQKLVQRISSEVVVWNSSRLGVKIELIEPREAMSLLSKEQGVIGTLCTLLLCKDDEVLREAQYEVSKLGAYSRRCVLSLICPAIEGDDYVSQESLLEVAEEDESSEVGEHVYALEGFGFLESDEGEGYSIKPSAFPALCALYYEARVRHRMNGGQSAIFVSEMVGGFDIIDEISKNK